MKESCAEIKICEACEKEFFCAAKSADCWCFTVNLQSETLENLRRNFQNCLCETCLRQAANLPETVVDTQAESF